MTDILWTLPEGTPVATLLLAHGAGAAMDSAFMSRVTEALIGVGVAVARFEFGYMAARRKAGPKRPPPKAETLTGEYVLAIEAALAAPEAPAEVPFLIGGKSMGGRVAAMAAGPSVPARVAGLVCLGYPFHPPGRGEDLRLGPLAAVTVPSLILQGERDEFGSRDEIGGYGLDPRIEVVFVEDGSHDFGPRGASPATLKGNIAFAAAETAAFAARIGSPR